jgi:hypothetical protein
VKAENKNAEVDHRNGRFAGRLRPLIPLIPLLTIAAVAALAVWLAFVLIHAMPQQTVAMAVYPEGSLNAELAKRYRAILARDGVDMKLVPSAGSVESVARLRDPKSGVSVALIPDGITTAQDSAENISSRLFWKTLPRERLKSIVADFIEAKVKCSNQAISLIHPDDQ